MNKSKLITLIAAAMLSLSAASTANETTLPENVVTKPPTQATVPNIIDPNTWFGTAGTGPAALSTELTFNAAHPSDWMKWIDPNAHIPMHMNFMNPATYAQFMQPQFYLEFMNPQNMAAWMDFNQYAVMWNPQTMAHWMNPGSYLHGMDPKMYTAAMNPANYMVFLNPATYAGWTGSQTCDPNNPNKTPTWFGC